MNSDPKTEYQSSLLRDASEMAEEIEALDRKDYTKAFEMLRRARGVIRSLASYIQPPKPEKPRRGRRASSTPEKEVVQELDGGLHQVRRKIYEADLDDYNWPVALIHAVNVAKRMGVATFMLEVDGDIEKQRRRDPREEMWGQSRHATSEPEVGKITVWTLGVE